MSSIHHFFLLYQAHFCTWFMRFPLFTCIKGEFGGVFLALRGEVSLCVIDIDKEQ